MHFLLIKIILCLVSFQTVNSFPMSFDEYVLSEIIKRELRSSKPDLNLEWLQQQQQQQQQNEIKDYSHDLDLFVKNELNKFRKKKLNAMEIYRSDKKDQVNKRNSPNNHNYYMQLCHFKICNMGKRRGRFWEE